MLAGKMMEEEFEMKEDEPWFDKQDLERDLQLAAELGKSLLDRNRELEQGLGQMYSTNQEQLQEIEYLTKQVELLRQVNDQHAKVYEQLDSSARELEQSNHKLSLDNRSGQHKIHGLTETVEVLQAQLEELQQQVEDMKVNSRQVGRPRGRQSISCLKELDCTNRLSSCSAEPSDSPLSLRCWHEEEREALRESLQSLQTQLASERSRRERLERDAQLLADENLALEQQLGAMEGCKIRLTELEQESEELRQLWKLQSTSRAAFNAVNFLHDSEDLDPDSTKKPRLLKRWDSDRLIVKASHVSESPDDHSCSCVRRHDAFKHRGISLLNEVDAQYSALQVKYDDLLRRCHQGSLLEDADVSPEEMKAAADYGQFTEDMHQPEYKELFREIFQRIQKTKEDLMENRGGAIDEDIQ